MAYSKVVEDFAIEVYRAQGTARGIKRWWCNCPENVKDTYLKTACEMMQNGWSKKPVSRDTIDWRAARNDNDPIFRQPNNKNTCLAFNFLMDLTQHMARWINDPEFSGEDYEELLRLQKETQA